MRGLFLTTWFAFFVGACLAWFHAGRLKSPYLLLVAIPVGIYAFPPDAFPLSCSDRSCDLRGEQEGALGSWLSGPTVQYLGRISYSLYLIHGPVGQRLTGFVSGLGTSAAFTALAAFVGLVTVWSPPIFSGGSWRCPAYGGVDLSSCGSADGLRPNYTGIIVISDPRFR